MPTFEEQYCAWLDDRLAPAERTAFEDELRRRGLDPAAEKRLARRVGQLLREFGGAPALPDPDGFNRQILRKITAATTSAAGWRSGTGFFGWSPARLAWTGAALVGLALALAQLAVPNTPRPPLDGAGFVAQILEVRSSEGITATPFYAPKQNVTVLWLEGLDYLPDDAVF